MPLREGCIADLEGLAGLEDFLAAMKFLLGSGRKIEGSKIKNDVVNCRNAPAFAGTGGGVFRAPFAAHPGTNRLDETSAGLRRRRRNNSARRPANPKARA